MARKTPNKPTKTDGSSDVPDVTDSLDTDDDVVQDFEDEEAPEQNAPVEEAPGQIHHIYQPEKDEHYRQDSRPICPRCGKQMKAVSSPKRPSGAITYYGCKEDNCPEKTLIPVPRRKVIDMLTGKVKRNDETLRQIDVSARDDMKDTTGT